MGAFFLRGILIGVVFGVPAGAIGALCLQRSFSRGFLPGLATGLASSVADCLYACAGLCGLSVLIAFLQRYERFITIVGAALIAVYGIMILFRKSAFMSDAAMAAGNRIGLLADFFSALVPALCNPTAVLSFLVVFSAFGIGGCNFSQGCMLVIGIFCSTGAWWLVLSGIAARFRHLLTERTYQIINRILGVILLVLAAVLLLRLYFS